uniref:Secreted protein n=1 Tax=Denticeps clupeoides TaxID=299321 RepID=A0AAY4A0R2_9TELE
MPGTFPTRRTTMRSLWFPVRTLTALLIVMLSRLMPLTSTSLSPTSSPACSEQSQTVSGLELHAILTPTILVTAAEAVHQIQDKKINFIF